MSWLDRLRSLSPDWDESEALDAFDGAVRASERAWHGTSLLARTLESRVDHALGVLRDGDSGQIAALLGELAHESYTAAAPRVPGLDAEAAARLSVIVMGLLSHAVAAQACPRDPETVATALIDEGRAWITKGDGAHADLARIAQLVRGGCSLRGALIAPLAPSASTLRCIARARAAGYAFAAAAPAAQPAEA